MANTNREALETSTELEELATKARSRGMSEIDIEIYLQRFTYIKENVSHARAYQMFIQELINR